MRHSRIAWRYMRGWFLFDVISSLPWEQMMSQSSHIPTTSIVALLKVRWHAGITYQRCAGTTPQAGARHDSGTASCRSAALTTAQSNTLIWLQHTPTRCASGMTGVWCLQIPRILRVIKVLRLLQVLRMARLTNLPAGVAQVPAQPNCRTAAQTAWCEQPGLHYDSTLATAHTLPPCDVLVLCERSHVKGRMADKPAHGAAGHAVCHGVHAAALDCMCLVLCGNNRR